MNIEITEDPLIQKLNSLCQEAYRLGYKQRCFEIESAQEKTALELKEMFEKIITKTKRMNDNDDQQ